MRGLYPISSRLARGPALSGRRHPGIFCLTGRRLFINIQFMNDGQHRNEEEGWEYGDIWKDGSPEEGAAEDDVRYVEVLRGDTGKGFDDSLLLDLVSFLGSRGIRATYDSFSLGLEPAAIKTYVLKVEEGREEEALVLLAEKLR